MVLVVKTGSILVKKQEFQELHEIQLYKGLPEMEKKNTGK